MKLNLEVDARKAGPALFVIAWAFLLVLTGISIWTAFLGLGSWAAVLEYGIAAVQTGILFIFFMRLKGPPSVKWVFAGSGFFWLSVLIGYSFLDYATRSGWPWHG